MVEKVTYPIGLRELRDIRSQSRGLFLSVGFFSIFVNLLMLTGPIYMLQVYDRVLSSRSEETLLALTVLVCVLYALYAILEWARGRVLARAGARFQNMLDGRVFDASLTAARPGLRSAHAETATRDVETMQRLMASPALFAVCDIPWTPIFALGIFMFHPWLGYLALVGGALLIAATIVNQWMTKQAVLDGLKLGEASNHLSSAVRDNAEMVHGLGMRAALRNRFQAVRGSALAASVSSSDRTGAFTAATKGLRLFLQSAMLGLGAYLVLQEQLTPGAMIAGSILMGRALAPIELAIGQWPLVQQASQAWRILSQLLEEVPAEKPKTQLPRPQAHLVVQNLTAVPPGEAVAALRMVNFEVKPGTAVGVIGPSAAGKSTLARLIVGLWRPAGGKIRLGGAAIDQYDPDTLGSYIGYLPQTVSLFDATIAENIARMSVNPDAEAVVKAAKRAGAHEMILEQPQGYDTVVRNIGGRLSGGQRQRIGLARAIYGDPLMLVLDEPNSNLDAVGSAALNATIRDMKAQGLSVIIMAHRPAAIAECDMLVVLEGGQVKSFGPRDAVLKEQVKNVAQIANTIKPGQST